jgi:hypothetical protein
VRPVTRAGSCDAPIQRAGSVGFHERARAAAADDSVRGTRVEHRASLSVGKNARAVADATVLTETRVDCVKRRPTTPLVRPHRCRIHFGPAV